MDWYYVENGAAQGPVGEDQFMALVASGSITSETLVWNESMTDWRSYGSIQGEQAGTPASGIATDEKPRLAVRDQSCTECGRRFRQAEMINYEGNWVCAQCKPLFFQRLREGVTQPADDLDYAGFWIRAGAKIIDGLIKWVFSFVIQLGIMALAVGVGVAAGRAAPDGAEAAMIIAHIVSAVIQLTFNVVYDTFFIGRFGATPGKMACGLKVVSAEGVKISYLRAMARHFAEYVSMITCYIGYIIAAFDGEKRALHDHICSTRVVRK